MTIRRRAAVVRDLVSELRAPDLAPYDHLLEPVAAPAAPGEVRVRFLGVSTLAVDDGETVVMVDGFFSRPGFVRLRLGRVTTDRGRVVDALRRAGVSRVDALLIAHSHVDHALDSATVAELTGAVLHGSASTRVVAASQGLDPARFRLLVTDEPLRVGRFTVTAVPARHSPGDLAPGDVTEPLAPRPRATDLRTGDCYSFHLAHPDGTLLVHASANYLPGVLERYPSDTVYLGIGALGRQPAEFHEAYWREVVAATGARRVVPIHWDNFTRALTRPLRPLPRRFDDLDTSMRFLVRRCREDGVELAMPRLWNRTDPFASASPPGRAARTGER